MRYLYIKYNYSYFQNIRSWNLHSQVIWDLIKKVLSYAISDDIESLNLNSNPGISPYANWIDGSKDGNLVFGLYLDTHKIKK
jgi:hypothetical protein